MNLRQAVEQRLERVKLLLDETTEESEKRGWLLHTYVEMELLASYPDSIFKAEAGKGVDTIEMPCALVEFLSENAALDCWIKNRKEVADYNASRRSYFNPQGHKDSDYLYRSFVWSETAEGQDYWESLDTKWKTLYK